MSNLPPVIFTHYGLSSYLEHSLACARATNPDARLILLGDRHNAAIARRHGWEHHSFEALESTLHPRFRASFRHVQGRAHNHVKNGRDWLRYVFERWLFIEAFTAKEKIERFWHFDSDTMLLMDLAPFVSTLSPYRFTVQCNNTCLNGITDQAIVGKFCAFICTLFEDADFLAQQQHEFDTLHPDYAFTEMRAFNIYKDQHSDPYLHLMQYRPTLVFDDCICQDHGFEMVRLTPSIRVKRVFTEGGRFYALRGEERVGFVSLNLSWVPDYVFTWVRAALNGANEEISAAKPSFLFFRKLFSRST